MGRNSDAPGNEPEDIPIHPVMVSGGKPGYGLSDHGPKCIILVFEDQWNPTAYGIARGGELRALEVEDDDHVERGRPMPLVQEFEHAETRPQPVYPPDR